jgi:predicted nuclease with TOPRIM domain
MVVRLEKFENLEKKVTKLVEQFTHLKEEKEQIVGQLKERGIEDRETKKRLEKLSRERYKIRSKLDALIDKLESIEHTG